MTSIRAPNEVYSSLISSSSSRCQREMSQMTVRATINIPNLQNASLPKLITRGLVEELQLRSGNRNKTTTQFEKLPPPKASDPMAIVELYAIMEAVADRVEMHKNIGEQRNNWNSLLLTSINSITLTASVMTGIAAMGAGGTPLGAFKLSSTLLYLAATGMLLVMNKIQLSQLAEEQRNAARLFKQLHQEIQRTISIGNPTSDDVKEAMEKVLALDKAYPLPLLGVMLEKFPKTVEPAVWWAPLQERHAQWLGGEVNKNGWDEKLEEVMREIAKVMNRKDKEDYLRLGEKALKLNKALAMSGPVLTALAAFGSSFIGHGSWAVILGVVAGVSSTVVSTIEHGGQVGMVFEMYRSNAGFFRLMEETIESNLKEREVDRRENGELFEMKVALQLGRSLSELRDLATSSSIKGEANHEFASKLF